METDKIKNQFLAFANTECKDNSELYYQLSIEISKDEELLRIAHFSKEGQPVANLFLASVHFLLLKNQDHQLAKFYPSISGKSTKEIPFILFKKFCLTHEAAIKKIISAKIVQTNVINRCAYLMPVFSKIISAGNKPATLIDIGTSAGLTLNFDQYEYRYNGKNLFGKSKVIIDSKLIDSDVPEIFDIHQPITKIGVDQHIVDLTNDEQILWLKALIWPDQLDRFVAMDEALKSKELTKIQFVHGSSVVDLEKVISNTGYEQNLIVYATHVLYQFSPQQKKDFYAMLKRTGKAKNFYFLSAEGIKELRERYHSKETVVELTKYQNGVEMRMLIAETNGHANWIKWNNALNSFSML